MGKKYNNSTTSKQVTNIGFEEVCVVRIGDIIKNLWFLIV